MQTPRIFASLAAAIMAVGLVIPTAAKAQVQPIDSIVALVEEDVILRSELDIAVEGIVDRIRAQGGGMPPQDLLEKQVLERLIVRKLQVQRAMQTGIRVSDADIDQALMNVAQQNGLSLDQLRQVITSEGEDFSEFRSNLGEEILAERLRQRIVGSMDPVSDTEIDILLASEDFTGGEYDLSQILVRVQDGATPQAVAEAQARVEQIHKDLENGMDFDQAAISYSESGDALEGGRIGWRDLSSIPREFSDAVRDLQPGQFSDPVRSPAGYHILLVNDRRERQRVLAEEYRANHIQITPNELVTARDAMDEIRTLHDRIEDGEDFAELAREFSDDTTSANIGGDMGWIIPEQFGDRFAAMLEGLEDGEVSEPFQTTEGWHIVQRTGYRETDVTDQALRNMARQTIMQRRADSEVESFIRQMREEAYVDIRLPG